MIRDYIEADKGRVLELLRLNIPSYFSPSEESGFIKYLEEERADYFVWEEKNKIWGCAGINYFPEKGEARLSWDIIHPSFHGRGLGTSLTNYRIQKINLHPGMHTIRVRTSRQAYQFYLKFGFRLINTERDYWAEGFDLYELEMELM